MPTVRGFVQQIEIGRAGLARTFLIHADGSQGTYVIRDLDADPERFNERLSKLAILRDAMDRAEPVEIEHVSDEEAGEVIERVRRITRDDLEPPSELTQAVGLIMDLAVTAQNRIDAQGESWDSAAVTMLTTQLQPLSLRLVLQPPERGVALAQLEMLEEARRAGRIVRVVYDQSDHHHDIVGVAADVDSGVFGEEGEGRRVDGFVESLSLLPLAANLGSFAHVRFTTAPPFTGSGNTISLAPFSPEELDLLVARGSLPYELFEAGLRDNLRMRVSAREPEERPSRDRPNDDARAEVTGDEPREGLNSAAEVASRGRAALVTGCALLAPYASASRPVWIKISRHTVDHGPDGPACTPGVPSSDLTARPLRDLNLPYPAEWVGWACFNEGVYRFQLDVPTDFTISVDGEELCVFDTANGDDDGSRARVAHACLGGHHEVRVALEAWMCDYEFVMDVFQIR